MEPSTQTNIAEGSIGSVIQAGDIYGDLVITDDAVIIQSRTRPSVD